MQLPEMSSQIRKGLIVGIFFLSMIAFAIAGGYTETIVPTYEYPRVVYDDVYVSLLSTRVATNQPDFNIFMGNVYAYEFQDNPRLSRDETYFTFQMPHTYQLNTPFDAHIHYSPDSNNSGQATFSLECAKASIGSYFKTYTFLMNTTSSTTGEGKHILSDFPSFNLSCSTISCIMQCKLTRESDLLSDNYTSGIFVHAIDFHIPKDTDGSIEETKK